jgi:hypothetical protein
LRFNAFLQDSADRLFLRKSASGYTFVHQIIRDYFAEYYEPRDPPYPRSALKAFRALVRVSQSWWGWDGGSESWMGSWSWRVGWVRASSLL